MVTIRDVAAHAGVGAGTVSRVLNQSANVTDATRRRVLASIDALDYQPNRLARALSRGRVQTVGAIVPSFTEASAVERLRGVVAGLDGSRYDLVLFNVESPVHRDEHVAALNRHRADGLIVMSLPLATGQLDRLRSTGIELVLVDADGDGLPAVTTDDVDGGRIAARHLVELGHRRIGFVGDAPDNPFGFPSSARREQGFREVLGEAGLTVRPDLVRYAVHDREMAFELATAMLTGPDAPTALFACSDVQAIGVIEAARQLELDVPGDVSVVGFDDVEISSHLGITTVHQPLFDSGRLGVEVLVDALDSPDGAAPNPRHVLPLDLVIRSTTAPPARSVNGHG